MFCKTSSIFAAAIAACCAFTINAAGLDGKTLVTNDWFDASFTGPGLTIDTVIATNTATGITRGAGTWTSAPTNGMAKIVADEDAGGGATKLTVDAPDEELTFTPAALSPATGMETMSVEVNTVSVPTLTDPEGGAQTAFAIYSPDGVAHSLAAYVSGGTSAVWTNFVYASAADLTNAWFTLTLDFATVDNVRYVRYSLTPPNGSLTVLADTDGTQWFRVADTTATTVQSISLTGTGDVRSFSGDSLAEVVATVNGVGYGSVADAIAAADDGGTVTLEKAVDGEAIAVSKDVTINGGGNSSIQLNAASINITEGKTLTLANFSSLNTIGSITGGGSIATSGNRTLRLGISGNGYSLGTLALGTTQGIRFEGDGTIAIATLSATVSSQIEAFDDAMITIAEADSDYNVTVAMKLVNTFALVKKGAGTINFVGVVATTAGFVVQGGNVIIDNSMQDLAVQPSVWLDASDSTKVAESEGHVIRWDSIVDNHVFTNENSVMTYESVEGVFGGKRVVRTNKSPDLLIGEYSGNKIKSVAAAVHVITGPTEGGNVLFGSNVSNYYIGRRSNNNWWAAMRASSTEVYLWQNESRTAANRAFKSQDTIINSADAYNGNVNLEQIGGSKADIGIAEFIAFNNTDIGCAQRKRVNAYLGNKWEISGMISLPASVPLTLAGGTSFGLVGLERTVDSVTVTGSGTATVTGGVLTIAAPVSLAVGQTLVIPYGSTYTCASGTGAMVDETAGTVTLKHCAAEIAVTDPETSAVTTAIYDTVAGAVAAYTEGTLTIHESATLDLGTTEVYVTGVELDDGVVLTFTQNAPWTTTISAGVLVNTRMASTYVWTPAENSTDWATLSNWRIGAATPVALPGESDTVQFPSSEEEEFTGWTVVLGSRQTIAAFIANTNVAISGAQICSPSYAGDGKLSLGNGAGFYVNAETTIANDLEIVGSVSVTPSANYLTTRIVGDLTGTGTLTLGGTRPNHVLSGDNSGFKGTISAPKDAQDRNAIQLTAESASSTNAIWDVHSSGAGCFTKVESGIFRFGSLRGSVQYADQSNYKHQTIEVGHLGLDDILGGQWFPDSYKNLVVDSNAGDRINNSNRGHCIRKVGAGTLTFSGKYLRKYEINEGTLLITADTAFAWTKDESAYRSRFTFGGGTLAFGRDVTEDPSSRIVESTAPICFSNAVGEVHTWATALAAQVADLETGKDAGLVKLGEGTLVLSAAPLYTGDTYLDGGVLKIPTSADVKVKTHVEGKSVRTDTTTEVGYTVYTLGKKLPLMIMVF